MLECVKLDELQGKDANQYPPLLLQWLKANGVENGVVRSKAYILKKSARWVMKSDMLMLSDGLETGLDNINLASASSILGKGKKEQLVSHVGVAAHVEPLPDFWKNFRKHGVCEIDKEHHFNYPGRLKIKNSLKQCLWCKTEVFAPKNFIVYGIKNTVTNRWYFGSTNNRLNRWSSHQKELDLLTHKNGGMVSDARFYGADTFKFMVLFRYDTKEKMLAREQLLISMHWHRNGCYNIAAEVDQDPTKRLHRVIVADLEEGIKHEFLTLHAAIRHFKLKKEDVREAIKSNKGKIGKYQFPVGVEFGNTRTVQAPKLKLIKNGKRYPKPAEMMSSILGRDKTSHTEIAKYLGTTIKYLKGWEAGEKGLNAPQDLLMRLIHANGMAWVKQANIRNLDAADVVQMCMRHELDGVQFSLLFNFRDARHFNAIGRGIEPTKVENNLMCLFDTYGPEQFMEHCDGYYREEGKLIGKGIKKSPQLRASILY